MKKDCDPIGEDTGQKTPRTTTSSIQMMRQLCYLSITLREIFLCLKEYLEQLIYSENAKNLHWNAKYQFFQDDDKISQATEKIIKSEISACNSEKLHPEILPLCLRLCTATSQNIDYKLCQSKTSKKTASFLHTEPMTKNKNTDNLFAPYPKPTMQEATHNHMSLTIESD
ncbi:uncharacterized protein LOC111624824 [Centruroides sculpturatus]|uniref:uncharacterized protein LOC111624824 n=1 Tax=Centruroides sculpturatus TaxID=218467 RepID=UPI000C6D8E41|nr:uncharacterized protein LOC111624824 [Centruroides sculpturatus]